MIVPPVIVRELRIALRKRQPLKSRFYIALSASIGVWLYLLIFGGESLAGASLHFYLFLAGLCLSVIPPLRISAGMFAEEQRNQTLELLYLAGMKPGELFAGKLLGGVLAAAGDLLALIPLLAVPFLCGGLSLDLFWATLACFPVLFFFTLSIGVLASVLSRDDGAATALAIALGAVVCLAAPLPYMLGKVVAGTSPFSYRWLCLSPAYAPWLVEKHFTRNFWATAGVTLLWSVGGLVLAAGLLRRNWQRQISRTAAPRWRKHLGPRLASENPFQWLAEQDRQPVLLAWGIIGGTASFWLIGWAAWPLAWPSPANFFLTALVLVISTGSIMIYAAAKPIGSARRDGTLELLLTTPLAVEQIVAGQSAATLAQFRPVRAVVFVLCVLLMLGGFLTRAWSNMAIISYLILWSLILGVCFCQRRDAAPNAMWIALNTGRPLAALFRSPGLWWWWIMAYNSRDIFGGLVRARQFPSGSVEEVFLVTSLGLAILALTLYRFHSGATRLLLIRQMRRVAQEPVPERDDPRFKGWNGRTLLPE